MTQPNTYRSSWRDALAAHLVDAALLVATPRFREIIREGAAQAIVTATQVPRAAAPAVRGAS